ncbi:hypothetical protein GCM10022402_49060 [Salinactinospora qingdaonensis]|uniref:Uncharacterized protein n=1 Tax=Salinactinospora qingdaonensis TaxID=702744 RepID=A0ABP7GJN2_9ACTN
MASSLVRNLDADLIEIVYTDHDIADTGANGSGNQLRRDEDGIVMAVGPGQ